MKLALFDDYRLGVVSDDQASLTDVTGSLPWPHQPDPLGAGWWVLLCRDFPRLRPTLEQAAKAGTPVALSQVQLRAPVLNPSKIVAAASNYAAHREEMQAVHERVGGGNRIQGWLTDFDVFLKAPSSIIGPSDSVVLPPEPVAENKEIHHESELGVIIGTGGYRIPEEKALEHVLGYTIGLDMTVRGAGDRSRRKSYNTFTPLGPWIATADEIGDPQKLRIQLSVNGTIRQDVETSDMLMNVARIIAFASRVMRFEPGDVIITGAPPGVGQVHPGDVMDVSISRIGKMQIGVLAGKA